MDLKKLVITSNSDLKKALKLIDLNALGLLFVVNTKNKIVGVITDGDIRRHILNDNDLEYGYLPEVITKMRVGGVSNRSLKNIIQKTREDYRAISSNNIGGWFSIFLKNLSKIKQFKINV